MADETKMPCTAGCREETAHFERFIVVVLLAFRCYTDKKEESRP